MLIGIGIGFVTLLETKPVLMIGIGFELLETVESAFAPILVDTIVMIGIGFVPLETKPVLMIGIGFVLLETPPLLVASATVSTFDGTARSTVNIVAIGLTQEAWDVPGA